MSASAALPSERILTRREKLAFGVGDLGPAIVSAVNGFFLNAFLLDVAGLRPAMVGAIFLIVKVWDAVNDPLIGALSDRTRTRWGRRRPWLLFGALPFGLAFLLHWLVPPLNDAGLFVYYLVVALLLDAAYTAVNVPYVALTPELSHDYDERTSLTSYRFGFSILGGVFAAFLHTQIVALFDDPRLGNAVGAAIWTFFLVTSCWITFLYTREVHFKEERPAGPGFVEGLRIAFRNRAFVAVTLIYLLSWLAIQFVQTNLLLYVRYWIREEEWFGPLILAVELTSFTLLLVWARVSQRIGKQRVYYLGMSSWIVVSLALYFVQPGQVGLLFVLAVLGGIGVSVGYLVPWSMLPDVVELDELETGQRREGVFFGFFVFLQKLGISLGLALSNFALELAGYVNQEPDGPLPAQPAAVLRLLRIFVGPVPAVILILSLVVVHYYPITREKHAAIRAALDARQRAARPAQE